MAAGGGRCVYGKKCWNWYDGFVFGKCKDIYNPWSIINFLKTRIDQSLIFGQLPHNDTAIWSLFWTSGYLKAKQWKPDNQEEWEGEEEKEYELILTNREVCMMFRRLIEGWFSQKVSTEYNGFIRALLKDDVKSMNKYMNKVSSATFSYFDTGKKPSGEIEPERFHGVEALTKRFEEQNASDCFYHGFVLGLMVDLARLYMIISNRESGYGRYDVMLEPRNPKRDDGIILEFKVYDPDDEKSLEDTVKAALDQIEKKRYSIVLEEKGIPPERIRKYGFAFEGKKVLIG